MSKARVAVLHVVSGRQSEDNRLLHTIVITLNYDQLVELAWLLCTKDIRGKWSDRSSYRDLYPSSRHRSRLAVVMAASRLRRTRRAISNC